MNALTHELVMITNDSYITADSVCDLLRRIAAMNLAVPITLVLDNARYQKCNMVAAVASQLNLELLFLPAYSPNLNLIERLWKFVKKKALYSKYYPDFAHFKSANTDCLNGSSSPNIAQPTVCIELFGDLGFHAGGYIVTCNKPSIWSCSGVGVLF